MTVPNDELKHVYNCSSSQTNYTYKFKIINDSDIKVISKLVSSPYTKTTLTLTSDYTVSGAGDDNGGYITLNTALSSDYQLILLPNMPFDQQTDYTAYDEFPAAVHENALDKLCIQIKQVAEEVSRAIKFDEAMENDVSFNSSVSGYLYVSGTVLTTDSLTVTETTYDGAISRGNDADKPTLPEVGDIYYAEDTKTTYHCYSNGIWSSARNIDGVAISGSSIEISGTVLSGGGLTTSGTVNVGSGLNLGNSTLITAFLDEDDMVSDSATAGATQQSIKAYVDNNKGSFTYGAYTTIDTHIVGGTGATLATGTTYQAAVDLEVKVTGTVNTTPAIYQIDSNNTSTFGVTTKEGFIESSTAATNVGLTLKIPKNYYFLITDNGGFTSIVISTREISIS